jgi:hypothetical protein
VADRGSDTESPDYTPHESGIPPARERLVSGTQLSVLGIERLELALVESTRTEANLGLLLRGLSHLVAGATAAQRANAALLSELEKLQTLLADSNEQEMTLKRRVRLLEIALEAGKHDAAREHASFVEQEDLFIAELLRDHERELADLKRQLRLALDELLALEARVPEDRQTPVVDRGGASPVDRVAARHAGTEPTAIGSMKLRTVRAPVPESTADSPESPSSADAPRPSSVPPRVPRPSSVPPLSPKPPLAERPVTTYSLGPHEVAEERVESAARRLEAEPDPEHPGSPRRGVHK